MSWSKRTSQRKWAIMRQLAERDGGWSCFYCHRELPSTRAEVEAIRAEYPVVGWWNSDAYRQALKGLTTVDHVVPESRGGSNDLDNLVLACSGCNTKKGTKTADEFLSEIERRRARLAARAAARTAA